MDNKAWLAVTQGIVRVENARQLAKRRMQIPA